jgi:hypothetical protein
MSPHIHAVRGNGLQATLFLRPPPPSSQKHPTPSQRSNVNIGAVFPPGRRYDTARDRALPRISHIFSWIRKFDGGSTCTWEPCCHRVDLEQCHACFIRVSHSGACGIWVSDFLVSEQWTWTSLQGDFRPSVGIVAALPRRSYLMVRLPSPP